MEEFLQSCRQTLQEKTDQDSPGFHVVLGNEACDVDSMVSALAFAYLLFKTAGGDSLVLPLLNIRQSELVLRSDNVFLLRQTGLSPDLLLFRDQLDLRVLHRAGRLRLTLVDHNVLPSSDTDLEGAVVEVLDHHQLERKLSPTCPVTVEMVGSCATLVTERIIQKAPQILDQQLAQLLYAATVVLDCVNMAPAAGKVTPKDSQYIAVLETRFPTMPPRGTLFQALQNAKFDVSGLNMEQMLLKDMKAVSGSLNVAVPVLYITLKEFLQRADLEAELSVFCQKSGFDLLLMMTISFTESKEPIRELVVFSHSASCREQVSKYLEQAHNPALNLSPISCPHPHISAYQQGNTLASRKKLLPLVKDFLRECDGDGCLRDTEEDSEVPPTPMNSLVDGCPLDEGLPRITAEDLQDKLHQMESADL
ncbi:exopolyphosphatase PRUNE1 isoform X3 [Girardinichthys multiradiatus]|uniref:exopolyphosphatase PRUNE1 isoform X3 n=1 Tax=Girardinichthys multiradiatus TaxID=208333 RepID=UPI001FAB64C9|nr:exopolyphosphatase PRUNE1 isoform X3 [Girardinichthys multiradiatus]